MAYTSGGLIEATDYNTFVGASANSVNSIWSTTYNQTSNVANVTAVSNTVTATQWAGMVQTLAAIGAHTNTTITSRTAAPTLPVAGNTISILANVQTDLNNCYTNRFNAVSQGTQFTGWTGTNSKTAQTGNQAAGTTWTISFVNTVTFANSTAATSFFNQGGTVKIQCGKNNTGQTGDPQWNSLAGNVGSTFISKGGVTQTIGGSSYTGTTLTGNGVGYTNTITGQTGTGWDSLSAGAAATAVVKILASGATYTNDFIQHSIAKGAASTTLVITTLWSAADTNVAPLSGADPISGGTAATGVTPGTAPCTIVSFFPPETTNISNNWGSITVAATTT